jgi:hypothetical protein
MAVLDVTMTCPACGTPHSEAMPVDRCVFFWECPDCHVVTKPKAGDCCVFCSYADKRCPFIQDDCPCPGEKSN